MEESRPIRDQYNSEGDEYQSFAFHPYNVVLILVIISLSVLFLALSISFIYTRVQSELPPIQLPLLFLLNTAILLGSSYTLIQTKRAYLADATTAYKKYLAITLGLSVFFLFMQIIAWWQLFNTGITITTDTSASYLYAISFLHFAHVIGGIPFLGYFLWQAQKKMKEPVSVLVYFSDPAKRLQLRLLTIYWHFLDALWIYLVVFFFINAIIH